MHFGIYFFFIWVIPLEVKGGSLVIKTDSRRPKWKQRKLNNFEIKNKFDIHARICRIWIQPSLARTYLKTKHDELLGEHSGRTSNYETKWPGFYSRWRIGIFERETENFAHIKYNAWHSKIRRENKKRCHLTERRRNSTVAKGSHKGVRTKRRKSPKVLKAENLKNDLRSTIRWYITILRKLRSSKNFNIQKRLLHF